MIYVVKKTMCFKTPFLKHNKPPMIQSSNPTCSSKITHGLSSLLWSCRSWNEVLPPSPSRQALWKMDPFLSWFKWWPVSDQGFPYRVESPCSNGKLMEVAKCRSNCCLTVPPKKTPLESAPRKKAEKTPWRHALCVSKWRSLPSSCHWAFFFPREVWDFLDWFFCCYGGWHGGFKGILKDHSEFSKFQDVESCWIYKQENREAFDILTRWWLQICKHFIFSPLLGEMIPID